MDRREFLKTLALTGAAVTMKWDGVMDIMAQNTSQAGGCDLVAVMGGEPAEMFRKAIAEFGGMGKNRENVTSTGSRNRRSRISLFSFWHMETEIRFR